jgi:hypothetical protein
VAGALALGKAAAAQGESGFETFTVPRETPPPPPVSPPIPLDALPAHAPRGRAVWKDHGRATTPVDHLNAQVVLTLFPGMNDLSLNLAGEFGGRRLDSYFSPYHLFQGNWHSAGFLQLSRGRRGVRFGHSNLDMIGSAQGLRLFSPGATSGMSVGLGLYQRMEGDGRSAGFLPAVDSQWKLRNEGWDGSFLLASDTSWRLTQEAKGGNWQWAGFAGHDARYDRLEAGMFAQRRLTPTTRISGRLLGVAGERPATGWAVGLNQNVGPSILSLEHALSSGANGRQSLLGAGAFLPLKRRTVSLRWQRSSYSGAGFLQGERTQEMMLATFHSPIDHRTNAWASAFAMRQSDAPTTTQVSLGASRMIDERWDVQAEMTQFLGEKRRQLRFGIGRRFGPEWHARLLFGPSFAASATGRQPQSFGIQITRNLNFRYERTGGIRGTVLLDGKPYAGGVTIYMGQGTGVVSDEKGLFRVGRVPPGEYRLRLGLASLPVDLNAEQEVQEITVRGRKTTAVTFNLRRVGSVKGSVTVLPSELGALDPTAGVGIVITAGEGRDTVTGAENEFTLTGLPRGKHRITLVATTIPPDFQVVGPAEIEVEVDPEKPAPVIRFEISPKRRAIEFGDPADLPTADPPAADPPLSADPPPNDSPAGGAGC